jgi:hypothetical protein
MCKFTRPLDTARGCSEPAWVNERLDNKGNAPSIARRQWFGDRVRCALFLADTLSLAPYHICCSFTRKCWAGTIARADTVRYNGVTTRDTIPPAIMSCQPSGTVPLLPEIRLFFTEPVAFKRKIVLTDPLRDTVELHGDTAYADTVRMTPRRRLHPGSRYRLLFLRSSAADMAGNLLKARDSTDTAGLYSVYTVASDSLAVSLSGCLSCPGKDPKRKWQFFPLSGGAPFISPDSSGCFRFDSLPYGKGFVGYFTDENNNNRPDKGSLSPWRPPEPFTVFADTIEARARWEVEGVTFSKACRQCSPHPVVAQPSTKPTAPDKKKEIKKSTGKL